MTLNSTSNIIMNAVKDIEKYQEVCDALVREMLIASSLERMCFLKKEESRKEFESAIDIYKRTYGDEYINEMKEEYAMYEKEVYEK